MAYVLRPGETEAPASLRKAYDDAKQVTDDALREHAARAGSATKCGR